MLNLTTTDDAPALANPKLLRLDKTKYLDKVRAYAQLVLTKREADAAARSAETALKAAKGELLRAMGTSPAAACGSYVLARDERAGAPASLTMTDGAKVPWDNVTALLIGNERIERKDVSSVYGGRAGSTDLKVSGG